MEIRIVLIQKDFFEKFDCKNEFEQSGLEWEELVRIYDDYSYKYPRLEKIKDELIDYLKEGEDWEDYHFHSISGRVKDKYHLIEKIIRKCGKERSAKYKSINCTNYLEILRDLVGVRILSLSKENWESAFQLITRKFPIEENNIAEEPIAYTRYGDRDIYGSIIHQEHTNRGYRSQHYIVKYQGVYCEIQARTLAEEVYGEFDHKVKYPYRESNTFLKRYTSIMAQHLDAVDEMISTCLYMGDSLIEQADKAFENDSYINWKAVSRPSITTYKQGKTTIIDKSIFEKDGHIMLKEYFGYKLLRKGLKSNE